MTDFDAQARELMNSWNTTMPPEVRDWKEAGIAAALRAVRKDTLEEAMRVTCDGCRLAGFKLIDGRLHRPPCDGMRCRALHLRALMDKPT